MLQLFPSLIASNLLRLEETIELLDPLVAGYHLDIMDFHFVPNLTWGPDFINAIRKVTRKQLFIHLMVEFPERYLDRFELHHGDIVSFHYESPSSFTHQKLLSALHTRGLTASIALNPETPIEVTTSFPLLEHLLIMSVHPGFSGQSFIPSSVQKVKDAATLRKERNLHFTIAVDGGVNEQNYRLLRDAGAEQLALATALFKNKDPKKALEQLEHAS